MTLTREIKAGWIHLGGAQQVVKDAVHPIADRETVLVGFEMNIAGARFYGLGNDVIHQFDDRGIAGVIQQDRQFLQFH